VAVELRPQSIFPSACHSILSVSPSFIHRTLNWLSPSSLINHSRRLSLNPPESHSATTTDTTKSAQCPATPMSPLRATATPDLQIISDKYLLGRLKDKSLPRNRHLLRHRNQNPARRPRNRRPRLQHRPRRRQRPVCYQIAQRPTAAPQLCFPCL
ncbi:hypothetical protein K432DRAFT_454000, partial [Lepidopterella palustris CBS 459.81]